MPSRSQERLEKIHKRSIKIKRYLKFAAFIKRLEVLELFSIVKRGLGSRCRGEENFVVTFIAPFPFS